MNIQYYHKNVDHLSETTQDYVAEKLSHAERIAALERAEVKIAQEHGQFHVHVELYDTHGHVQNAEARADDIYGCIDMIEEQLKKQLRRGKEKHRDLVRRGARSVRKKMSLDPKSRL